MMARADPAATAERVLVVDDERAIRDGVARILRRSGYQVLLAGSPQEALQLAEHEQGAIDLLLTDVVMPDLSGPRLAERLVAIHAETRVLFMSGYSLATMGATFDPDRFLQKPFLPEDLLRKVRDLLERPAPSSST